MADNAASLHEHAVQAEKHLEQLATGLAKVQADEGTVQTVSKMADVARKIVSALGAGQEETSDAEPPAPGPETPAPGEGAPAAQPHTMDSATSALHQDMQASAAKR